MTALSADVTDTAPRQPTTPPTRRRWLLAGAVVTAAALAALVCLLWSDWPFWGIDFAVYRQGAETVLSGGPLYEMTTADTNLSYTYTPVSALLFLPVVILPHALMTAVWVGVELLFLLLVTWLVLDAAGVRSTRQRAVATVLVTTGAIFLFSVDNDLSLGQVNIMLMFLVLLDLLRGDGRRWQGVWIGLAAGIKLVPLIYVVYLAVTGRVRAAATALGVFAAAVTVGFALLPSDSVTYWFGAVLDTTRVGEPDNLFNQSLRGMVARLTGDGTSLSITWLVLAAVVAVAGLAAAAVLHRRGQRLRAVMVCALATLLVSPVSWEHHWVWVVPLLLMIAGEAWRRRSAAWATLFVLATTVFSVRLLDLAMPRAAEADDSLAGIREETAATLSAKTALFERILPNSIVLAGIFLLVILAFPAVRPPARNA